MKISELILKLEEIKQAEGDLQCFVYNEASFSRYNDPDLTVTELDPNQEYQNSKVDIALGEMFLRIE